MASGQALIDQCKAHLIETMRELPECAPGGPGLRNNVLEREAEFELGLPKKNNWFTWSLLFRLILDGSVEVANPGERFARYRLT